MPRRIHVLIILLVLASGLYAWTAVDWSRIERLYRDYRQVQSALNDKEQIDVARQKLKAQFGENADLVFSVDFNLSGTMTRKVQAVRECGRLDDERYLDAVIRLVHDAGLGWPDEAEYLYRCKVEKPVSFGMPPDAFSKALVYAMTESSFCPGALVDDPVALQDYTQQSMYMDDGILDMDMYVDEDGNVFKAHWKPNKWQVNHTAGQYHLLLCLTHGLVRLIHPELTFQQVKDLSQELTPSRNSVSSTQVGNFRAQMSSRTFEMMVSPARDAQALQ